MDDELDALRAAVNDADDALVRALAERWRAVQSIAAYKRELGIAGYDPAREALVRARWRALGERDGVPAAVIDAVFDAVIAQCRAEVERANR